MPLIDPENRILLVRPLPPSPGLLPSASLSNNSTENLDRPIDFYDRILALPVEQLKLMAKLFTAALAGARSWGGTPKSGPGTSSTPTPLPSLGATDPILDYDSLFATLQIQPFPDTPNAAADDEANTQAKTKTTQRSGYQKRACFDRQLDSCAITGGESNLQHAHIIPHSIVSLSGSYGSTATVFWMALAIILGPSLRDTVFSIVGAGENFYNTTNSIALVSGLHGHLDTGQLHLVPQVGPVEFDARTTRHLDLRICWLGSLLDLALIATARPQSPADQVRLVGTKHSYAPPVLPTRAVADGDRFRLFTNDPEKYPLPHPLLLGIHTMLWRMIATAGMAETTHARKRRHVDAVDGGGSKRAKRGSAGMRRAGGRRGGSSARSKGGSKDGSSLGADEVESTPGNKAGGAAVDATEDLDHREWHPQSVRQDHSDDTHCSRGPETDSDTRSTAPSVTLATNESLPLNTLELAWIRFRLKFGASRHDASEYQWHSSSSSEGTSGSDEEFWSDESDEEVEDEYEEEEDECGKKAAKAGCKEASQARMDSIAAEISGEGVRF